MSKITDYGELTSVATDDELVIVDVSDTSMAASGTTKRVQVANLPPAPPKVTALTDASSIAVDASAGNLCRVTLGGNRTLANPSSPADGQALVFEVIQDATGSRTLAYGTAYSFPASIGTPVLSVTAGFHDFIAFRYDAAATTWYCVGFTPQQGAAVPLTVAQGGMGLASLAAFGLLAGGTTPTGAVQQVGLGTSGQLLTSNGAGALPSMQPLPLDSTAADIQPTGAAAAAGSAGKAPDAGHVHASPFPVPADFSQIAWTFDPGAASGSSALVSGTVYLATFFLRSVQTLAHIGVHVVTLGSGLTAGESLLGIYSVGATTATLQGQTADQSAVWTATGAVNTALTSAITNAPVGRYAVAFLCAGTTPPAFRSGGTAGALSNLGLAGAALRFFINSTGQTALPSTLTLSSSISSGSFPFAAVVS